VADKVAEAVNDEVRDFVTDAVAVELEVGHVTERENEPVAPLNPSTTTKYVPAGKLTERRDEKLLHPLPSSLNPNDVTSSAPNTRSNVSKLAWLHVEKVTEVELANVKMNATSEPSPFVKSNSFGVPTFDPWTVCPHWIVPWALGVGAAALEADAEGVPKGVRVGV